MGSSLSVGHVGAEPERQPPVVYIDLVDGWLGAELEFYFSF